jgi:hypothetical protein
MENKINYKKILDKLECIGRIATHQRKRIITNIPNKMEVFNDAMIVIKRYSAEIENELKNSKGYSALPDKDEHKIRQISWW